jgi:tetratricopeptide (TPR) repeat protein
MMRGLFLLWLLFGYRSSAQDIAVLLSRGARLEAAFKEEEALPVYQQILQIQPHQLFSLCRCSDLICRIGNRETDRDKKIADFKVGYRYAQTAYQLDSTSAEVNIVMAFSLARMALIQSGKERVAGAREIKRYAEQALRYDPGNYKAYHILGRWQYEVSNLNFIERTLARWFFGALPEASLDEAIRDFQRSMASKPDFLLNYYELARCWRREGQKEKAIVLLQRMEAIPDGMYDDRTVRQDGRRLLAELK